MQTDTQDTAAICQSVLRCATFHNAQVTWHNKTAAPFTYQISVSGTGWGDWTSTEWPLNLTIYVLNTVLYSNQCSLWQNWRADVTSKVQSTRLPLANPNLKQLSCFMRNLRVQPRCKRDLDSCRGLRSADWQCAILRCVKSGKNADLIYVNGSTQWPARAACSKGFIRNSQQILR